MSAHQKCPTCDGRGSVFMPPDVDDLAVESPVAVILALAALAVLVFALIVAMAMVTSS